MSIIYASDETNIIHGSLRLEKYLNLGGLLEKSYKSLKDEIPE